MTETPSKPPDPTPDPDWGRRRRGAAPPPPSIGVEHEPTVSEPSERQRGQDRAAGDEARLRAEWDGVSSEWDRARADEQTGQQSSAGQGMPDLSGLFMLLDTVRSVAPAELQERTTALIREVLLTLRSLIDWYLERLDHPDQKPEVQDIPID